MPLTVNVEVRPRDREVLASWARSPSIRAGLAQRARIVLLAGDGVGTNEIARRAGVSKPTVILWKKRYAAEGTGGLEDRPKPGKPRTTDDVAIVLATLAPPPKRPAGAAHGGGQHRCADLGEPGQGPGQLAGVGLQVVLFAGGGVGGELGLDGAQQPDLGGHFGGQLRKGHRRVAAIEFDGGGRGGAPLTGPLLALLLVRGGGDQGRELGFAGRQQRPRAAVVFQHGQVGLAQIPGQRGDRQQLPDQILDPGLVLTGRLGQPGTRADPPVQRRRSLTGQLQWLQPARVGQRHPGQRLRIDPVRLGVPAQEPAQVRGLGRGHPVDSVAPAGEEHRDRHPRWPGRLEHHRQRRALRRPRQRHLFHRRQ